MGLAATTAFVMMGAQAAQAADPPGNNGTVKIAEIDDSPDIPNNDPHVNCPFKVQWFGFDEGADIISHVTFEMQAPTADVIVHVGGPQDVFVGGDPAGGGTDLDAEQVYSLTFEGDPHPQQGYHVKMTVNTPGSQGADVKHKVFWVQPCKVCPPPTS